MKMIGIAGLKSRLSEYLNQVKAGEEVTITNRGAPVARIIRVETDAGNLDRLVREGLASVGTGTLPKDFLGGTRPRAASGSVTEALLDERRSGR